MAVNAEALLVLLVAHLVVRNEADRYFDQCLSALSPWVDRICVYDDNSSDNSVFLAESHGADVVVRGNSAPSFLEHEGEFRQAAWESMGTLPQDAWVMCLDADEFLTGDPRPHAGGLGKCFKVEEVFDVVDDQPLVRVDGYWDQITACRLAPWTAESAFPDRALGCGSLPEVLASRTFQTLDQPRIRHYGYARPEDREEKYYRYRTHRGHHQRHVESILGRGEYR